MNLKTLIANIRNFGGKRSLSAIKYIVIHYTGNDGDTDESNGRYFNRTVVQASAHYFVDSDSVTQSVHDDRIAWSVGGKKYASCSTTGGGKFYGKCTNSNSISIEICDDNRNGVIAPSEKTIQNALALTKMLMEKYNVPAENVIRHFDVTGKLCPAYWAGTAYKDTLWRTEFWNKLHGAPMEKPFVAYRVRVTIKDLNIRKGPGTQYARTQYIKPGVYTISAEENGWGKLKSGAGWIKLSYTKKL